MNPVTWRVAPGSALRRRDWGDGTVLFHDASGDTHLLDELGVAAIICLQDAPARPDELLVQLAHRLGYEPDAVFAEHVGRLLQEFDDLGLIEPVP